MSEPFTREPTQEEGERVMELALVLARLVETVDTSTGIGAVGLLLEAMFLKRMKRQYILPSFDDFTRHHRKSIEEELRNAHN